MNENQLAERKGMAMNYAEKQLQQYAERAEYNWYDIIEQTSTRLRFNDSMQTYTHQIVECLIEMFATTYPDYQCSVLRSENNLYITYRLKLEKDNELIRFDYEYLKTQDVLKFWDYQRGQHTEIKQRFKDAVEEMPEFRLRLLTGDLTKVDTTND